MGRFLGGLTYKKGKRHRMLPEIIIKAYDLGYKIKEVPSNHRGRKWGKSSLNFKIMFSALSEALRFSLSRTRRV